MPDAKRDVLEVCYPNNANGASAVAGASYAWSAWTQLTASLADHLILTGLSTFILINATATPISGIIEFEVGVGAAGSEQPIARAATAIGYSASGTLDTKNVMKGEILDVQPTRIAAGARVAVRATSNFATAATFITAAKLYGYAAGTFDPIDPIGDPDLYLQARHVPGGAAVVPSLANATVTTGASLWTFGSWAQIVAAAAAPLLVTGVATGGTSIGGGFDLEIGTGSAGNEVSRALVPICGRDLTPGPGYGLFRLARPLFVKDGERIAARARGRPASTGFDLVLQTQELNN